MFVKKEALVFITLSGLSFLFFSCGKESQQQPIGTEIRLTISHESMEKALNLPPNRAGHAWWCHANLATAGALRRRFEVTARVRDLNNLGRTLDAAVAAGGNTLNGVTFGLQNPDAALNDARRSAMTEARARAALYASASGLSIHRIISISEGGGYTPPMPMPMMARAMDMAEGAPTPVAPGEVRTQVQVNVVFELR
jgi:hypothetical protein